MNDSTSPARAAAPAIARACVFDPTDDPLWLMADEEFTPVREHEFESLSAVSNGYLGHRGSLPLGIPRSAPMVFIAGVFDVVAPSSLPELVAVPGWTLTDRAVRRLS